ncbi:hypothetical protein [Agarivorans sp. QJM3NY_33]|uniref:hypothetical protein n=1 Tax=Agarivorans sp. QJM3NY_33 TaxID=3421432 RepID=UPI003D7ECE35
MMVKSMRCLACVLMAFYVGDVSAEMMLEGYAGLAGEVYAEAPLSAEQCCHRFNPKITLAPKLKWWNDDGWNVLLAPYSRYEPQADVIFGNWREANIAYNAQRYSVTVGIDTVYWGVTEVYQPINIVNQYDGRIALGNDEKIGQPMLHFQYWPQWGEAQLLLLPFHQVRPFREPQQRLSPGKPVGEEIVYSDGKRNLDLAARVAFWRDELDLGISLFNGNSREPMLLDDGAQLLQSYATMTQLGLGLQWTRDDLLWKWESVAKHGEGKNYLTLVTGAEYSLYGFEFSPGQLGLIAEYTWDNRDTQAPPTLYNHDLFVGLRWQANDVSDTELLLSGLFDLKKNSQLYQLTASGRVSNHFRWVAEGFWLSAMSPTEPIFYMSKDSYLSLGLEYYF